MRRREFLSALGGAAASPFMARAEQSGKMPIIGFLGGTASVWNRWTAAFVERLRELGWVEGRTVGIEYRWAEGKPERIAETVNEFIRLKVDVIVTNESAASIAKQATSAIPILFVFGIDPIGTGLVASLARPGGNITGLSQQSTDIASKKIEFLRKMVPNLRRVAILVNSAYPQAALEAGNFRWRLKNSDLIS